MTGEHTRGEIAVPGQMPDAPDDCLQFGPFRLIRAERLLVRDGAPVPIGGRAFDLLVALADRAGEVVSTRELSNLVWSGVIVEEANLRVCIVALRKALGDNKDRPRYILNVAGRGYTFVAPVQRVAGGGALPSLAPPAAIPSKPPGGTPRLLVSRNDPEDILSRLFSSRLFVNLAEANDTGIRNAATGPLAAMLREQSGNDAVCFAYLGALPALVDGARPRLSRPPGIHDPDPENQFRDWLAEKRILVVINGCRHVIGTALSLYDRLFHAAASVHFLTTSRDALRVEGDNVHSIMGHFDPPAETRSLVGALRAIGVTAFTYNHWRREFGGLTIDGMKRLEELERENQRLRRAISDLTLEKLILKENALGNF